MATTSRLLTPGSHWGILLRPLATVLGAMLFLAAMALPAGARENYAYEQAGQSEQIVHYFDTDKEMSWLCRRDWGSIGCGGFDSLSTCDYGRFCIRIFGEEVPFIIPREGETLSVPGMTITTSSFEFYYSNPCLKTRVVLDNGDWTENISCGSGGMMTLRIKTKREDFDLFLRSWNGLGEEPPLSTPKDKG